MNVKLNIMFTCFSFS